MTPLGQLDIVVFTSHPVLSYYKLDECQRISFYSVITEPQRVQASRHPPAGSRIRIL